MIRNFLILVVLCLCLVGPARANPVELVFWTTEIHEDRLVVIEFLAKAFGVMQDDVTVKVVSVNENELVERMQEAKAANECPHLVGTGSELLVALSETDCLDVDAASRLVERIGRKRFYAGALDVLATPGGKSWYGVPFHGWVQGIWYRADWFEAVGLEPPTTWSGILEAARAFTDPAKGRYGILVGTGEDHYATQVFNQIAASNGAAMFSASGNVVFNSAAMTEALEFYAELAECTPPGPQTWRARDYFLQGRLAMMFYSTFIMDDLALERVAANSLTCDNFSELDGGVFDPNLVQNVRMAPLISRYAHAGYGMINGFGLRNGMSEEERAAVGAFLDFIYAPPPVRDVAPHGPGWHDAGAARCGRFKSVFR